MAILQAEEIRRVPYDDIDATYVDWGDPTVHPWRAFKMTNTTDGDMMVSINAATDQFILPAASFTLYDIGTNAPPIQNTDSFLVGIGTQFSVRYLTEPTAATAGDVWLEGIYAKGE